MLSGIGFRDFFIVAPAFYEFMVIELKTSWQKVRCGRGEAINLFFLLHLSHFPPQNPVVIINMHILLKSLMHILHFELCTVLTIF